MEDQTGKLEKRLLLRQIITKALDIRRAEMVELARRDESKSLPPNPFQGLIQETPQKLTFYDVVQLARQQALAEKTRRSSEDLIDFSDAPQPVLSQAPLTGSQWDLDLLNSVNPVAPQQLNPFLSSQNESWTPSLDQYVELASNQPAAAELDASTFQKPSLVDSVEPVDLQASQADVLHEMDSTESLASAEFSNQPNIHSYQFSDALPCQGRDIKENSTVLEPAGREASLAGGSDGDINQSYASLAGLDQPSVPIHQSNTTLIDIGDNPDEALADVSSLNTVAPSIFSHSSSLTSATAYSLPGITEEDVQARNSSSQISLKTSSLISRYSSSTARGMASCSARPLIPESLADENDAELHTSRHISSTPTTHADLESPAKPQRTQSQDSVSLSPSLPQLSNIDEADKEGFPWIVQAARDGN